MVKHIRLIAYFALVVTLGTLVWMAPLPVKPAKPVQDEEVVLEMTMYPIVDSDHEFLLVYKSQHANHDAEWLQKDGKRLRGQAILNCPGEYFINEGDSSHHFKVEGDQAIRGKKHKWIVIGGPEMEKYRVKEFVYSGERLKKLQAIKYKSADMAVVLAPDTNYESLVFVVRHEKIEVSATRLRDWPPLAKALATVEPSNPDYQTLLKAFQE